MARLRPVIIAQGGQHRADGALTELLADQLAQVRLGRRAIAAGARHQPLNKMHLRRIRAHRR